MWSPASCLAPFVPAPRCSCSCSLFSLSLHPNYPFRYLSFLSVRLSALSIRRSVCCPFFRRPFVHFSSLFHLLSLSLLLSFPLSSLSFHPPSLFPPLFTLSLSSQLPFLRQPTSPHLALSTNHPSPLLHLSPCSFSSTPSLSTPSSTPLIISREPFSSLLTYPTPNTNTSSLAFDCPAGRGTHHHISFPPFHTTPSPVCKSQ